MIDNAKRGLALRKEFNRGGTEVGVRTANKIINKELNRDLILKMYSYHERHQVDKKAEGYNKGEKGYPSAGFIAILLWGGDAGRSFSTRKRDEINNQERAVNEAIKKTLQNKVKDHNEEVKDLKVSWNPKVTYNKLLKVYERGLGAYNTNPGSVRPSVKSPQQWAFARTNSFNYAMKNGKFRSGKHDTDLLPANHPVKLKMNDEKDFNMKNKEIRVYECSELRTHKVDDNIIIRGYASVFEPNLSHDLGGFKEKVSNRAFDKVLESNDNVFAFYNHNSNIVFASTESGTLKLKTDERGLISEITMPNTQAAKDTIELVERGVLQDMSFGFTIEKDSWTQTEGKYIRTIEEIKNLAEVSIVPKGAYPQTSVSLRSFENYKKENVNKLSQYKNKLKLLKLK